MPEPAPLPWGSSCPSPHGTGSSPEEAARCSARLRERAGDAAGMAEGQGPGTTWVQGAPLGPMQHGRLLELGRAPSYVHSCFIIGTEFQDRQEEAGQRGQGRQQVAARSRCARRAWKWRVSSRSRGLRPLSPCSEIPARKTPNGPKASGSAPKFSSPRLTAPPQSLVQRLMQGMSNGQGLPSRVLGGREAGC